MTDCKVGDNIPCFGTCSSKSSKPCSPVIKAPWYDEKKDYTLDGTPTLTTESFLVCAAGGGIIEFLDSGQETAASESAAMRVSVSRGYTPRFALSIAELASKQIVIPTGEDLPVRDFNEGKDKYVDWDDKAGKGKGIIRIYKREDRTDIPVELTEGEDFYIKDGKAYYYNNVRAILEAQDCNVDFKQDKGKGNSRIEIASLLGMPLRTLYEGTDYTIGNDGKAHFKDGGTLPPGAEKSKPTPAPQQTLSGQTGAGTASSTQTPNDYGFIWPVDPSTRITDTFMTRGGHHRGVDFGAVNGTEIYAISDGKVLFVDNNYVSTSGRGHIFMSITATEFGQFISITVKIWFPQVN
jgi:murein DD-endopeptidase MepM/ murein hydrolase activator NlpD